MGSLICGVSTSSNMFIVGRAIAGMGSSGVGNGALTILSASIPLAQRARTFWSWDILNFANHSKMQFTSVSWDHVCSVLVFLTNFGSNLSRWSARGCYCSLNRRCIDGIHELEMV